MLCFFFFSSRRRHTRWPRDWSSDVCSSDLEVQEELDKVVREHSFSDKDRPQPKPSQVEEWPVLTPGQEDAQSSTPGAPRQRPHDGDRGEEPREQHGPRSEE